MQLPFSYSLLDFYSIAHDLYSFVFVYNFYVYLITGKQFRAELHKLFCACCRRCRSSSSSAADAAAAANDDVRAVRRGQADTAVWNVYAPMCNRHSKAQNSIDYA